LGSKQATSETRSVAGEVAVEAEAEAVAVVEVVAVGAAAPAGTTDRTGPTR
jgi:hypothetical protein